MPEPAGIEGDQGVHGIAMWPKAEARAGEGFPHLVPAGTAAILRSPMQPSVPQGPLAGPVPVASGSGGGKGGLMVKQSKQN